MSVLPATYRGRSGRIVPVHHHIELHGRQTGSMSPVRPTHRHTTECTATAFTYLGNRSVTACHHRTGKGRAETPRHHVILTGLPNRAETLSYHRKCRMGRVSGSIGGGQIRLRGIQDTVYEGRLGVSARTSARLSRYQVRRLTAQANRMRSLKKDLPRSAHNDQLLLHVF